MNIERISQVRWRLDARQTFDELLGAASDVEYVGPVYGGQKEQFYRQLDVFLFPTNYANEAEPLVIYEAMRQGVHVIACDRGSIAEMLRNGAGLAFTREHIVESAAAHIAKFNGDRHALAAAKRNSMQQAQRECVAQAKWRWMICWPASAGHA